MELFAIFRETLKERREKMLKYLDRKPENSYLYRLLLILACLNLMGHGAVLMLGLGLLCLLRYPRLRLSVQTSAIFVLIAAIWVSALVYGRGVTEMIKAANYFLLYAVGYSGYREADDKKKFLTHSFFCIFLGFFLQLSLQYIYNLIVPPSPYRRIMYSIWTGGETAVTLIGLLCAPLIGYAFYAVVVCKRLWIKVLGVAGLLLSVIVNVKSGTRSPFFLMIGAFAACTLVYLLRQPRKSRLIFLLAVGGAAILAVGAFALDLFGLRTRVMASELVRRFVEEGLQTRRWEILRQFLENMPDYLWGGGQIKAIVGIEAHNYLQQAYDLYGLIAFLALTVITLHFGKNLLLLLIRKQDLATTMLLVGMYVSLFIQCCLEPVITGYPICLWLLLMTDGVATAVLEQTAIKEHAHEDRADQHL